MAGRSSVTIEPKYRFTGKEKSEATGHYLFGGRTYNPLIGRWDQVDPMANKYPGINPFNYCENSPLRLIDPDGNYPWIANQINSVKMYELTNFQAKYPAVSFSSMSKQQIINAQNMLCNSYSTLMKCSPDIAKFLKQKYIPVGIASSMGSIRDEYGTIIKQGLPFWTVGKACYEDGNGILMAESELNNGNEFTGTLLHETIHLMGYGEFQSFSAEIAFGTYNMDVYIATIQSEYEQKSKGKENSFDYYINGMNNGQRKILMNFLNNPTTANYYIFCSTIKKEGQRWVIE